MEHKIQLILMLLITLVCYAGRLQDKYFKATLSRSANENIGLEIAQYYFVGIYSYCFCALLPKEFRCRRVCTWYEGINYADAHCNQGIRCSFKHHFKLLINKKNKLRPFPKRIAKQTGFMLLKFISFQYAKKMRILFPHLTKE